MQSYFLPLSVLAAVFLSQFSAIGAQTKAARVPVTIALSEAALSGSRFLISRTPSAARADVILIAPDASPEELSTAVRALLIVRQREGDNPIHKRKLRVRPTAASSPTRAAFPWAAQVLADASRSNRTPLPGVGSVRAVQIWLPSQDKGRPAMPALRNP